MTRRYLSEPEAWRHIARQWVMRTEDGVLGSCPLIQRLYYHDRITEYVCAQMKSRLNEHLEHSGHPYIGGRRNLAYPFNLRAGDTWASHVEENREARALAALWLALEAEEAL